MRVPKIFRVTTVLAALAMFSAAAAVAQQYVILHAEYGTERRHVDVTDRLRQLARSDRSFRMGNSTFGVDPDHGHLKTLRIYARGPEGQRMFEYQEGSTVDGAQFQGWGRGDWGNTGWQGGWNGGGGAVGPEGDSGQYAILHAEYGTERRHVDVTDRLRQLARSDHAFRMGNSTFGVDPDHGQVKTLRIYTRGPQGDRMFEYREGSTVDGAQFRGWGQGNWGNSGWQGGWNGNGGDSDTGQYVILHAEYGTERHHVDVTDRLRQIARSDRAFRMGNSTFGIDPDHGRVKTLRIYTRGPEGERMFEYREGSTVDGSQFRGWGRSDWGDKGWNGGWDGGRPRH